MTRSEALAALRRANPRGKASFAEAVDAAATEVRLRIATAGMTDEPRARQRRPRRRLVGVTAGVAVAAAAAAAALLTVGSSGVTPGVENAAAAIKKAALLTAVSAEQSGTASVRITHDGQLWAHKVVRWNGDDLAITDDSPGQVGRGLRAAREARAQAVAKATAEKETAGKTQERGRPLLVVNGMMYGHDPDHDGWVEVGPLSSIDPGSGTSPADILAAVREDVAGMTLRRLVGAMTASGPTTAEQGDGSTVYRGTVAAGQIASEAGFKEGQAIRVFPFGYVAHDEAAVPTSPVETAVTVGADGVIREIAVAWGTWTYTVTYSDLGSTPALVAPGNAKSLRELRQLPPQP